MTTLLESANEPLSNEAAIKQYVDSWKQVVEFQVKQLHYLFQIQQIYTQRVAAAQVIVVIRTPHSSMLTILDSSKNNNNRTPIENASPTPPEGTKKRLSKDTTKQLTEYYNKTDPKELLSSLNITRLSSSLNVPELQITNYLKNKRSRQPTSSKKPIEMTTSLPLHHNNSNTYDQHNKEHLNITEKTLFQPNQSARKDQQKAIEVLLLFYLLSSPF